MLIDEKPLPPTAEPPPYSTSQSQFQPGSSSHPAPAPYTTQPPPPDARRCNNLVAIVDQDKITGAYIIDPSLDIPESLLVPLEDGETTRPNLKLKSTYGKVDVDVWVIPSGPPSEKQTRSVFGGNKMVMSSSYANLDARLHTLGKIPWHIVINFDHNKGKVTLPHDFVGKIFMTRTYGSVKKLPNRVVVVSDVKGEMKAVVGDLSDIGKDGWEGHTVEIKSTYGRIELGFTDEVAAEKAAGAQGKTGFWSSWFGGSGGSAPSGFGGSAPSGFGGAAPGPLGS